ncbi:hypothetical protein DIURU_003494 [Diutina rugosa]|uniref:Coatomer subunit delta n=1 Tax=Diutina rugosa TaxID=5481 RepID=A0A642UST6_DIURU|nr:uncharacterized protein DIURU_003494 [Diutina rugosa]KAA8901124.1 hypothetical protein DIURU_003494 [Diutina rugosa]
MAVLAASICTRGGKPLLSRQFRDVSQDRITSLLANFPALISDASSQHTTVEDDEVRYVYQPIEELYVVLITSKNSNILADIDTLHLFVSTVSTMLRQVDDREVFDNAFELISAFDEIVNLGFKENLTLSQVQQFLEMDSHEEKIQEIIERNKELEAAEERKRKAKEIQRRELAKRSTESQMAGISGAYGGYSSPAPTYQSAPIVEPMTSEQPTTSKFGSKIARGPSKGGLQLGKKNGRSLASSAPAAPDAQPLLSASQPVPRHQQAAPSSPVTPSTPKIANEGILLTINEKISAQLSREGSVDQVEIKGDLQLRINNPEYSHAKILLKTDPKVQYKTHPNVNKQLFAKEQVISSKEFPSNDRSIGVLRWRVVGKDDSSDLVPLLVTAWVSVDDNIAHITLEYEVPSQFAESLLQSSSLDAAIQVPVAGDVNLESEDSRVSYEVSTEGVKFTLPTIDVDHLSGSFEFSLSNVSDEDQVFPMSVDLAVNNTAAVESDQSLGKLSVVDVVTNNEDEESLPFDLHVHVQSENYHIN